MQTLICQGWKDYELLDSGNGMRLERFGPYITARPDPQAIWLPSLAPIDWQDADVFFKRTSAEKGIWQFKRRIPEKWLMHWKDVSFWTRLTSFKHTGVFPEQALHWKFIDETITKSKKEISVLNLFGYTGISTVVAAAAGAKVTHVDASKPSIFWAKENLEASKLSQKPVRWILDDAVKFVEREIRRGSTYDAIIMDPPIYGHGPTGQIWKFQESFPKLMKLCSQLLSKDPCFMIVNAYAISASSIMLGNVLGGYLKTGTLEVGELALEEKTSKRLLSTGIFARWHQ
ncbi:MAG TPA: class I SAM-dependent methyltransferase [Patescibacteria group bacterium]|nr:class I SAM-dependent methyltransferase [Patescibacteria group bacterium]